MLPPFPTVMLTLSPVESGRVSEMSSDETASDCSEHTGTRNRTAANARATSAMLREFMG